MSFPPVKSSLSLTALKQLSSYQTFRVGCKAFIDSFGGMVKCEVVAISKKCYGCILGSKDITVRVTESKAGYRKHEMVAYPAM